MYMSLIRLLEFFLSVFSVDEYVNIAKEKHGYNTEQVTQCCLDISK